MALKIKKKNTHKELQESVLNLETNGFSIDQHLDKLETDGFEIESITMSFDTDDNMKKYAAIITPSKMIPLSIFCPGYVIGCP